SLDKTIRCWDLKNGSELRRITGTTAFQRVAFSPDGARLAAVTRPRIRIFDAASGAEQPALALVAPATFNPVLAFSPDGQQLATASDRVIRVWNMATGKE